GGVISRAQHLARVLRGHSPHLLCVALLCLGLAAPAWAASPTLVPQPGVTAPASIAELARALKNDVNLIYEYVYTNIDYSPPYGLKKGALGTLLDGRGNDFDQAALLVALLRQAGYTASYVYLAAAMGYSQSSFLATAESGYTLTGNSIQNLNTANLQSALTGYANNLVSYIKANMLKR